ncbi:acetyl-CoA carboxylase biotin carboxylase subunit [Bdellovibrio svalbardensis]|uniref:Acetyl-CoA carboxylase biotin carboxylase subunit n=1 Tax=Bdellovibrio svalbardensis TaxID=2972972 RepID=A0ABT6DGJ3_9BACT|nr:acetyl-CoA carboxylase biotin carboxylase subunit [Bdellovibrio svalbardensis]MDG0814981.1 acetyl-CoA carboxylase biotin carboxylase subunit [Bdellovibrio svalbardensis]
MAVFKKILIANRGEIAIRITRACREMGIGSVAVFSDADRDSLHVFLADEAYHIGPSPSKESYLNYQKIIEVAKKAGADAIHPGYGFLSENTNFAKACDEAGITFIGPTVANIEAMGDKISAKTLMKKSGVPTVPGSDGGVDSVEEAIKIAEKIGLPVIIKASAGGGGKGMRVVRKMDEIESAFRACRSEGQNYFADPTVYIEKFINDPKHIEIQVFGDKHNNHVHLFERECSVQRRNQKIIEESPSPSVPQEVRLRMGEASVRAAKQINYVGAGTIEYIFDNTTKEFFFMEMNTRLQVEHPITEIVTGVDLVREQINVAAGKPLSFKQEDIKQKGHAIEARICAEDPVTYKPSPGVIRACRHPQGPFMRVDSYAYPGYNVPIFYDPMISKLITWGDTREEAINRMQRALSEFVLTGIKTNIVLHRTILDHPTFRDGTYTTQFIEKNFEVIEPEMFKQVEDPVFLIAAAIEAYNDRKSKDIRQLNVSSTWRRLGRKMQLRT